MSIPSAHAWPTDRPPAAHSSGDGGAMALWDWRRQIARLYGAARTEPDPRQAWTLWRDGRDRLFAAHPQSALDETARRHFSGLPFFDYDGALRFAVRLSPIDGPCLSFEAGHDGALDMRPFARTVGLTEPLGAELTLYWITGYGGGVFLPFADATSGSETYGAGRYLLDTIKGADLGGPPPDGVVLDFNFAYNPSCCYSSRYVCPLAPAANRLPSPVRAGEKTWPGVNGSKILPHSAHWILILLIFFRLVGTIASAVGSKDPLTSAQEKGPGTMRSGPCTSSSELGA